MEKVLSNKLPTLRNQMMKKLMSFQSVLHRGTFTKYMNIVINKNKVSVLKINDELNKIDAPTTTQITKKISQPKKVKAKIDLNEIMKTRQPKVVMKEYYVEVLFKKYNEQLKLVNAFKRSLILKIKIPMLTDMDIIGKLVIKNVDELFGTWIDYFLTDEDFYQLSKVKPISYLSAFKIRSIESHSEDKTLIADMLTEALYDTNKISMFNPYISTQIDLTASSFGEMMIKKGKKNECVFNAILNLYEIKLKITREKLMKIIDINEDTIKNGVSIQQMKPFFIKYKIPYRIYDALIKKLDDYTPPICNKHVGFFYALMHSNHMYVLDKDIISLAHKMRLNSDDDKIEKLKVSPYFHFQDDEEKEVEYIMINSLDCIVNILKSTKSSIVDCITINDNLNELFFKSMAHGYQPKVICNGANLIGLKFKFNDIQINIYKQSLTSDGFDGEIEVKTVEHYKAIQEIKNNINKKVFIKSHASSYTDEDKIILDEYRTIAPCGNFVEFGEPIENLIEIDITKAYSYSMSCINQIPIFNEFDIWKQYNGHKLEDFELYMVLVGEQSMFFHKKCNLCYGFILKKITNINYTIKAYKTPSIIVDVKYKQIVENLYKTKICDDVKTNTSYQKIILNTVIGILEKSFNKRQATNVFDTIREANTYKKKYGGEIIPISTTQNEEIKHEGQWTLDGYVIMPINNEKRCYALCFKGKQSLNNGFRYVKELLMQLHNYKMYKMYNKLVALNIKVYSVKTDALTIHKNDFSKIENMLGVGVGSWRLSKGLVSLPSIKYECIPKLIISITPIPSQINIPIANEWDTNGICELIINKKHVMITGMLPGVGKSYIAEYMQKMYKVLFVVPTNKLALKYRLKRIDTLTMFKFRQNRNICSEYDVIVFDEILFSNIACLMAVKIAISEFPEKIFIGTGDALQLPCVEKLTINDQAEYVQDIIKQIFPYNINLFENKRLTNVADKQTLLQFKEDIFNKDLNIITTLRKYIKFTKDIKHVSNISFTNKSARIVSSKIRDAVGYKNEFEINENVICKTHTTVSKQTINVNCQYTIEAIFPTHIIIKDICPTYNDNEMTYELFSVPLNTFRTNFISGFCFTCHSVQGQTIETEYTIFDIYNKRISREWLYTAITRATALENITIYDGFISKELEFDDLKSFLTGKIGRYISQDIKAKRTIGNDYATPEHIYSFLNTYCLGSKCSHVLLDETNITLERVDNELSHTIANTVGMCKICNCSGESKYLLHLLR